MLAELETIRVAIESDKLEAHERTADLLKLAAAFGSFCARGRATETLQATVQGSFVAGAHDEDYQLKEWVLRFGEWVDATAADATQHRRAAISMARRLVWAKAVGTRTDSPARHLVRVSFAIDPGLAVDMADWFRQTWVLDGPDGLAGLIQGAAADHETPPQLVAEVARSIYMPAAIRALPGAASKLVERGGESVRQVLADGVRRWVLPTFRARWGEEINKDAPAPPTPWIGDAPAPSKESDTHLEPAAVLLDDGTRLSENDAARRVSSRADFIDLLKRVVTPAETYNLTPLGAATRKVASELKSADIDPLLASFAQVRSDWASYSSVAVELIKRGETAIAEKVVDEARRRVTMRGWSGPWDEGSRRKFWTEVVEADPDTFINEAIADFTTALRVDAVQLSALAHELPNVLPVLGLNAATTWSVIDNYLTALCRPAGTSSWEPEKRGETGAAALLRYTADLAGHPVRPLEWGGRSVLRKALSDRTTAMECAGVIGRATGKDEAADEALLSVVAAVQSLDSDVMEVLVDPVKRSNFSPDQIVRDAGRRAADNLGIDPEIRAKRPLPLSYTLAVPPLPPRGAPLIDEEGIAILDPLNPRSHLSTYDDLLQDQIAEYSNLDPAVLVWQGARLADDFAERGSWTRGGVQAHAQRIKATGWLRGYRPWALMVGRRGAAAVVGQLADARVLPDPFPFTLSERLEMIDPELEFHEPQALPEGVVRPARRDRWAADTGNWIGDTAEAARIYEATRNGDFTLGESMTWTEFSWNMGRERRTTLVRPRRGSGSAEVEAEPRPGISEELEKKLLRSAFNSAAGYRSYAEDTTREVDADKIPFVVGGRDWWAELRWGEWLALNPDVGLVLGWVLTDTGLFEWVDETAGERMARSRWWTQSLETHHPPQFEDDAGEGWQVIVTPAGLKRIVDFFGPLERWSAVARSVKKHDELEGDVLTIRAI